MNGKTRSKIKLDHFETSSELAEIKVSYRSKLKNKIKIRNSKEAAEILYSLYDKDLIEYQEMLYLLLLNRANGVLGWINLGSGGTSGTVVDPKMVFSIALQANASSIVLSHNHPSGNTQPSQIDRTLTEKLSAIGSLLDICMLDHIIVAPDGSYFSFADAERLLDIIQ